MDCSIQSLLKILIKYFAIFQKIFWQTWELENATFYVTEIAQNAHA